MTANQQISDNKLVSLIKKGNDLAFRKLYDRYWEKLYIAAYRVLGEETVCEDIVQDIFLDFWKRSSNSNITNPRAYLYQAVRFQVAKSIRKAKFTDNRIAIIDRHLAGNNIQEYIAYQELRSSLDKSISNLPARCKEIFCLSREKNLSNKKIAQELGISVLTVETQIKKALKIIRHQIDLTTIALMLSYF